MPFVLQGRPIFKAQRNRVAAPKFQASAAIGVTFNNPIAETKVVNFMNQVVLEEPKLG